MPPDSFVDKLTDIPVHMVSFSPFPYIDKIVMGMTLHNYRPEK